jgi:hypothetical protein
MGKRISGLLAFLATACWPYFWEFIRSLFYERGSHMLNPFFENISLDQLLRWGPAVIFATIGFWLFWKTRPPREPGIPIRPEARSHPPSPSTGDVGEAEWSDERHSHVNRLGPRRFMVTFLNRLRATPTLIWLSEKPEDTCHAKIGPWSTMGFTVELPYDRPENYKLRFFADARARDRPYDPLEDVLEGKWYGDRFLFKQPRTVYDGTGMFNTEHSIQIKPGAPRNTLVEINYSIRPVGRYPRLLINGGSYNGDGIVEILIVSR